MTRYAIKRLLLLKLNNRIRLSEKLILIFNVFFNQEDSAESFPLRLKVYALRSRHRLLALGGATLQVRVGVYSA